MFEFTNKLKIVSLISFVVFLLCAGLSFASSSNLKINNVTYSPLTVMTGIPSVACNIQGSSDESTLISTSFISGKRNGKSAFVNLTFNLPTEEYNNLMAGDMIAFQHGNDVFAFSGQKVFLIFSEGSSRKTRTMLTGTSVGTPSATDASYLVMGTVDVIEKRADGCLDFDLSATVTNPALTRSVTTFDPRNDCIRDSMSEKIRTVPSVEISGRLFPEKFSGVENTSGSTSMLCGVSSTSSSSSTSSTSTSGFPGASSSGFTIPDFGSSSGFTFPSDFGSSGFTVPGL